jgi:SAM-dependent methyltransferase
VERARAAGGIVFEGALEELEDLPWGTFDVVTCWDVLEHTPDPNLFMKKLARLLSPGGLLALSTLNWNALVRRALGLHWSMIVEDHFTYWTSSALQRLIDEHGMFVVLEESFGLGRDFLAPLDRVAAAVRGLRAAKAGADGTEPLEKSWDANPFVLRVEEAVNTVLRKTGAGVDLFVVSRPMG